MRSVLTITTPASDLALLSIAQLRAAADVSDMSQDTNLKELGARASATIAAACKIRASGAIPPTLREESLLETLRLRGHVDSLLLARRPIISIASLTENGTALTEGTDFEADYAAGILYRLSGDVRRPWCRGHTGELKELVAYTAGWATVPDDLARAAQRLVKHFYDTDGQEANLRIDYNEGVNRTEFFAPPGDALLPPDVDALLGPYKNLSF